MCHGMGRRNGMCMYWIVQLELVCSGSMCADCFPVFIAEADICAERMIDFVEVLSIDEWNEKYPEFPLLRQVE